MNGSEGTEGVMKHTPTARGNESLVARITTRPVSERKGPVDGHEQARLL
jgi:hypothetical protein